MKKTNRPNRPAKRRKPKSGKRRNTSVKPAAAREPAAARNHTVFSLPSTVPADLPDTGRPAITVTREFFQPARVHYEMLDRDRVLDAFRKLECMDFYSNEQRWVWLYCDEAKTLKFPRGDVDEMIILGSFRRWQGKEMILDVRSFERVAMAIAFFDKHIPRTAARVTDVTVFNKLMSPKEAAATMKSDVFAQHDVSRVDLDQTLAELKSAVADDEAGSSTDKMDRLIAIMMQDIDKPLPLAERFPTNFYEDGLEPLERTLLWRQRVAMEHWNGNTEFSFNDLVREMTGRR